MIYIPKTVQIISGLLALINSINSLSTVEIFYDSYCERCPFLFGMNMNELLKTKTAIENFKIQLNPFAQGSFYKFKKSTLFTCPKGA